MQRAERRRRAQGIVVLALALACQPAESTRPSLLLVSLDTVRADHTTAYGYERDTTPHLAALARQGVVFDLAYAPTSTTAPTHASFFTSLHPTEHGVVKNGLILDDDLETLAEILHVAGYATAGFAASYVLHERFGWSQGFDVWDDRFDPDSARLRMNHWEGHDVAGGFDRPGDQVVDAALAWLDDARPREQPFLLFVHLFDAHEPYVAPEPYGSRFRAAPSASLVERETGGYDAGIAMADHAMGRLLEGLVTRDLAEDTLVVTFGDHGQGLFEHGVRYHGRTLYEEQVRVPLVARWPGQISGGRRYPAPVQLVDVVPTVIDLLELQHPMSREGWRGRSIAGWLLDEPDADADPKRPIFLFRRHYDESAASPHDDGHGIGIQLGVRRDRWKYIEGIRDGRRELYDLSTDPREENSLAGRYPGIADSLAETLDAIRPTTKEISPRSELDDDERARLRALGYSE